MQTSSFEPLAGMRIVVTRPKPQAQILSDRLRKLGATTIEIPTIEIIPTEDTEQLDAAVRRLGEYDWVIFTSVHGVSAVLSRLEALELSPDALSKPKVAAIGPATANKLTHAGRTPDFMPREFLSEKIAQGLGAVEGKRILLPRADVASKKLPELLRERGAIVDEVDAYETVVPSDLTLERVKANLQDRADLITFTSPSTIRNLAHILGNDQLRDLLKGVRVACIGPVTLEAARELGIVVDVVAMTHTIDALVEAIVNEIRTRED